LTELLTAFLEQSALYSQMDLEDSGDDYVRLMTIHSAKGLEFKVVFLIAAEETIFPGRRSLDSPEGEEEERRLAYVAITRAREKLYVTTARSRMLYGQTQCLPVSRFIREMPPEALEEIGGSTRSDALTYGVPHPSEVSAAPPDRGRRASRRTQETRKGLDYLRQGLNAGETSALPARPAAQGGGYLLPQQLRQGMRVVHARFGAGRLVSSEAVAGDAVVVIQFDNGMKKTLLLKQARLKKE
jgi:DNA helicase-2/ATP-dependent DNA helicase PcrA